MTGFPQFWARIAKLGALPADVTPHVLRHSFASLASDLGYSEPTIAALVGHAGRSITSRYVHSADAVLLAAADAVADRTAELMGDVAGRWRRRRIGEARVVMRDDAVLDIARLIAGDEPPGWLLCAADKARDMLSESRRGEAIYPKRARQRQQLVTLHSAIAFVRKAIRNPTISATLLAGDNHFHNQNETDHGLADLAKRAATAIGEIPPGGGRNKFQPDGLRPQVKCALMVSVLWTSARGVEPPTANETAQRACEALWKAASVGESVRVACAARNQRREL